MAVTTERVTVRMMRSDPSTNWGFRLQGDQDLAAPLVIAKVHQGGLADRAGLLEGDHVLQISGHQVANLGNQAAEDAIVRSGNNLDVVVERPATRIWRPQVTPVDAPPGDMNTPPVKYSLAHDRAPQDYSTVGSGHNVQARPFGQPQQAGSQQQRYSSSTSTKQTTEQYNSPPPLHSRKTAVEEYLQKTGGLFGTDPKLNQKIEPPSYLTSETLRLIKESETRTNSGGDQGTIGHKGPPPPGFGEGPRGPPVGGPGAPICDHCGRLIHGVFCKVGGKTLHGECFKCATCGSLLKNVGYFLVNDKIYCEVHSRQQREPSAGHTYQPNILKQGGQVHVHLPHVTGPINAQARGIPLQQAGGDPNSNYSSSYQYHKTTKTTTSTSAQGQQPYAISVTTTGSDQQKFSAPPPPPPAPMPPAPQMAPVHVPPPPPAPHPPQIPSSRPPQHQPSTEFHSSNYKDPTDNSIHGEGSFYAAPAVSTDAKQQKKSAGSDFSWPPVPADDQEQKVKPWRPPVKPSKDFGPGSVSEDRQMLSYQPIGFRKILRTDVDVRMTETVTSLHSEAAYAIGTLGKDFGEQKSTVFGEGYGGTETVNEPAPSDTKAIDQTESVSSTKEQKADQVTIQEEKTKSEDPPEFNEAQSVIIEVLKGDTEVISPPKQPPPSPQIDQTPSTQECPLEQPPAEPVHDSRLDYASATLFKYNNCPVQKGISYISSLCETDAIHTLPKREPIKTSMEYKQYYAVTKVTTETQHTSGGHPGGKAPARRGRGILKQVHDMPRIPICESCNREIRGPFVMALNKAWCPEHFVCASGNCHRQLLDIGFIEENGLIYCEFCYEKYFAPTCSKCSRPIIGDCLTALDRQWHPDCFVCAHCRNPFGSTSFFVENGQPYCETDWNQLFTTKCFACNFPIEAGDRWVEALNNAYHSDCFNCSVCQKNLEGQSFYAKSNRPFCKDHA